MHTYEVQLLLQLQLSNAFQIPFCFLLKSIPFRACVFFGVIYKFVLKHFNNKPKNSLIRSLQTLPPPPPPATHKHGQVMHSISLFKEFSVKCFSLFRLINDFLEACCGCG